MARRHWKEWLPQKVAQLKADGDLESTLQVAARQCAEEVAILRAQGNQGHEAEEVALPMFILLKPEPKARDTPAQRKELAAKEAEHQRVMRCMPRTDEEREAIHRQLVEHVKNLTPEQKAKMQERHARVLNSKG